MDHIKLDAAIDRGRRDGADEVEVYCSRVRETSILVTTGRAKSATTLDVTGAGIRVLQGGRLGFAHTTDISERGMELAVSEALDMCRWGHADEHNVLPDPSPVEVDDRFYDPNAATQRIEDQTLLLESLHDRARSRDPKVAGVAELVYYNQEQQVRVVNSRGIDLTSRRTSADAGFEVIVKDGGQTQAGIMTRTSRNFRGLELERLVDEQADQAVGLLGAVPIKSCNAPVILSPFVAAQLVSVLSQALTADAVQQGRSAFVGRIGDRVGSPQITLSDDPWHPEGELSAHFDSEGVPCRPLSVIDKGVLTTVLYDTVTARRDNRQSTGHGNRSGYQAMPQPLPSNLLVQPSDLTREELFRQADRGLFVTGVFGISTGGVDPVSGNVSVGVVGFWVENGAISHPVREVTIAGTLLEILERVIATADDLLLISTRGVWGSPSVLIEEMSISGN